MKNFPILLFILIALAAACKKDEVVPSEEEVNEQLLAKKIEDIIPKRFVDSLKKYGLDINSGIYPPNIEGEYLMSPQVLVSSNIAEDAPNHVFVDNYIRFYNQNNSDFSIELESREDNTLTKSVRTAISGSGNKFTVYGTLLAERAGQQTTFAYLYSGSLDETGIAGFRYGLINMGTDGNGQFIKHGGCRIIDDRNGFSPKQ